MPALWMGDEMDTADRLDRVTRERSISDADWIKLTRRLAERKTIPTTVPDYMKRQTAPIADFAIQPDRNRMPLAWYLRRLATYQGRPIELDCAGLWAAILIIVAVEIWGLYALAGALVEFVAGVLR